jgi:hypothetical protein
MAFESVKIILQAILLEPPKKISGRSPEKDFSQRSNNYQKKA